MKALLEIIYRLADLIGVNFLWLRLTKNQIRVLMYHGVESRSLPTFYWTRLDQEMFVKQIEFVKRKFSVERLSSLLASGARPNHPTAVITFDDGLENTHTVAWSVLQEARLCATCFVVPGLSASGGGIWADELYGRLMANPSVDVDLSAAGFGTIPAATGPSQRAADISVLVERLKSASPHERRRVLECAAVSGNADGIDGQVLKLMTREQITELAGSREFEIGGHSDTHPILSTQSPEEQRREIEACLERLKGWGIAPCPVFAYPNGRPEDFDEHTIAALKQQGCRAAVTTVDGLWDGSSDFFRIPRIAIGADMSFMEFKARMSGLFYFLRRLRRPDRNVRREQEN